MLVKSVTVTELMGHVAFKVTGHSRAFAALRKSVLIEPVLITVGTENTRANPSWFFPTIAAARDAKLELKVSTDFPGCEAPGAVTAIVPL